MDRRKDGRTLFYRTLPAEAGGPISKTSKIYDDVSDYEICGFHKNTEIYISQEQNIFPLHKKIH